MDMTALLLSRLQFAFTVEVKRENWSFGSGEAQLV
jgi:hypothetical protein